MSINKQQMIVSKLIDEIMIAALGNIVVLILMVAILNGSPLALLSALVGVGFAGRLVTRPSARPPRWTPTVAGLDADYAQEEEVREWVRTAERPNGLPIIFGELSVICVVLLVSVFFFPLWPDVSTTALILATLGSFLGGGGVTLTTYWLVVYKRLLRSLRQPYD